MPSGIYKHKIQQGFQKGHILFVSPETYQQIGIKVSRTKQLNRKHLPEKNCQGCNNFYIPRQSKSKFCSNECYKKWYRKENANNWQGGKTPENSKIRHSLEMVLWRQSCMERDDWTCQKTGIKGGKLVVHHIQNFADFPQLRTSISNGITLSLESHKQFHKIYGRKNNTREQLEQFIYEHVII